MAVLDVSDIGFVVSQGTVPSVVGTAKLLPVLETVGFGAARQRVVLSHNYRRFAGALSVADIESRLGRPIDHVVPYDRRVLVSMNTGEPYALKASVRFGFGRHVIGIVDDIETPDARVTATASAAADRGAAAATTTLGDEPL
jgi:pilus assembly protein CpaE